MKTIYKMKKTAKSSLVRLCAILALLPLGGVGAGLFTSCSDYLDKEPDTELTTEMVFENRDKVYSWLS